MLRFELITEIKRNNSAKLQNNKNIGLSVINGDLDITKHLYKNPRRIMDLSTKYGCMLYFAFNEAARKGYLDIIKWLYAEGSEGTLDAIDYAAENGYLKIVKWLYAKGLKGTSDTVNYATKNGYLDVLKFLHTEGIEGTSDTLNIARWYGYFEIVQWLILSSKIEFPDQFICSELN